MTTLIVIAKECLPGKVKTRLHPPLSLEQAAELAAASLHDTLAAVAGLPATRRVLAFDGVVAPAAAAGYDIVPQVTGGLDERLGAIFDGCTEPAVLIGMDTPQVSAAVLAPLFEAWPDDVDAWFGPAADGGFWALALRHPDGDLLRGVPMSESFTGAHQLARLRAAGLRVRMLPTLTDVDHIEDALQVAALAPTGRFAATLAGFGAALSEVRR
ncbi:TIGR04282 family arsenosugar biosynthesis glycosyltransferase [Cryobacterium sp. W22_MBD10_FK3]|uniref:TIGR04282 family arsenosugar biosynthesis glycosyltransferase n=1 Tax=Cryobacterium sp. W22_MBD10_FK3 TaxID=3240273 RepID=UPI003F8EB94C